jgi:hypothetical protein
MKFINLDLDKHQSVFFVKMVMTLRYHTIQKLWVAGRIPAFKGAFSAISLAIKSPLPTFQKKSARQNEEQDLWNLKFSIMLPSTELVSIIDDNNGTYCSQKGQRIQGDL